MSKGKATLLFGLLLAGCGGREPLRPDPVSSGMAKKNIVKGTTTQAEIIEWFGSPNVTTRNKSGEEVWTYDRVGHEAKGEKSFLFLFLYGSESYSSSSGTRSLTLIITFDDKDVVREYTVRQAQF